MNVEQRLSQVINIKVDKTRGIIIDAQGVMLPDAIRLCLTAIEALCKKTLDRAPDDLKLALEEDMYEQINMGASALLDRAFPNVTARPDLTVDAILEAETALFEKQGKKYVDAYNESAQSVIDQLEHTPAPKKTKKAKKNGNT